MDIETIVRTFDQRCPRAVCLKMDSPDEGVGFRPFSFLGELAGGGAVLLVIFLLLRLVIGEGALWGGLFVACVLGVFAIPAGIHDLLEVRIHRRLARCGEAAIGTLICRDDVLEDDNTPAPRTRVTVEYEFQTRSGVPFTGKRSAISGWFKGLEQGGPIVVIYLPEKPSINEPYNSLCYRVCQER